MIFAFSGCDGAGKSTQIKKLKEFLDQNGYKVKIVWARGGYTPVFSFLKGTFLWLMGKRSSKIGSRLDHNYIKTRQSLLSNPIIARIWLAVSIIDLIFFYSVYVRAHSWLGTVVLADRYIHDTKIDFRKNFNQCFREAGVLWSILEITAPKPLIHAVLTLPVELSIDRSKKKHEPFPDDAETLAYRLNCYETWPEFRSKEVLRIHGEKNIDQVQNLLRKELAKIYED